MAQQMKIKAITDLRRWLPIDFSLSDTSSSIL